MFRGRNWANRAAGKRSTRRRRLLLEALEDRRVLATLFWQGDVNNSWSDPGNWNTAQDGTGADQAPQAANNDVLVFDTNTPGVGNFANNNDVVGLTDIEIRIVDGSANTFVILGNGIELATNGVSLTSTNGDAQVSVPLTLAAPTKITASGGQILLTENIANAGHLLTLEGTGGGILYSGVLSGTGGVTVSGIDTVFSSANTYEGITTIENGKLLVNGSTAAASLVNVNNGGTLGGNGNVQGPVNVNSGGVLSPGLSPGILMTGNLNVMAGATFTVEIDGDGGTTPATPGAPNFDQVQVTGSVTLAGNLSIMETFTPAPGQSFVLIANDGADAVSGTFAGLAEGAVVDANFNGSGLAARITYVGGDGNDVALLVPSSVIITADSNPAPSSAINDGFTDIFRIVQNNANVDVFVNGALVFSQPKASIANLTIVGSSDNDQLTVDTSGGLVQLPQGIRLLGGVGFDTLAIDAGGGQQNFNAETISPASQPGDGRHTLTDGVATQVVDFFGLEPLTTNVPVANFTIAATPGLASLLQGANQINYEPGQIMGPTWGRVTVDNFEPIEFTNKTMLTIDAGAGSDEINLNNPTIPAGPLTGITVNGNDPTGGSDTLTVNGILNMDDAIVFTPTPGTDNAGNVTGAGPVPINFATIESLVIDGQRGDGTAAEDVLTTTLPAGVNSTVTLTPGATPDAGRVQVDSLVTMSFHNLGAPGGRLLFTDPDATADTLIYNGTDLADRFTVPFPGAAETSIALNGQIEVDTGSIEDFQLRGGGGDDRFQITPPFRQVVTITTEGGEPGGSDQTDFILNNVAAAPRSVAVEFDNPALTPTPDQQTIQQNALGVVTLLGIETANILAAADNGQVDNLFIAGTRFDDVITYTPLSNSAGHFTVAGEKAEVNFNNFLQGEDSLTITGGSGGVADEVVLNGTNGPDLIQVDGPTRTAGVNVLPPLPLPTGTGTPWRNVVLDNNTAAAPATPGTIERITAHGRDGEDTFWISPFLPVAGGPPLFIDVDGGSPLASDALVISRLTAPAAGFSVGNLAPLVRASDFLIVNHSRQPDAGNVIPFDNTGGAPTQQPSIAYQDVEVVAPNFPAVTAALMADPGDPNLMILGPDLFEQNEGLPNAAFLGSGAEINVRDLAIFPNNVRHPGVAADLDVFGVVAEKTGTLDFQVYFPLYAANLLPGGGQLGIEVLDSSGAIIAGGAANTFGGTQGTANARVRIPAVAGQTYYLRVFGATAPAPPIAAAPAVINGYKMTILNAEPPVPFDLELNDIIQVATVNNAVVATTSTFSAGLVPTNSALSPPTIANDFVGKTVEFTTGANAGRRARIAAFAGGTFTVGAGLAAAPAVGDVFLVETTDTGRSQLDDVLRDNTPIITFRLDDDRLLLDVSGNIVNANPPAGPIPIPFNPEQILTPTVAGYRVPVFIEGNPQQPAAAPQTPIGYARPLAGTPGVYIFDFGVDAVQTVAGTDASLMLTDGSHFLSAKVEITDPAAGTITDFGGRSQSLEIVVDTGISPVAFGDPVVATDGLHTDSDTGVASVPGTERDRITSDTTPTLWGTAEANSIIRVYIDTNTNGAVDPGDVLLGKTVAVPLDGTNQFPAGQWQLTSIADLNDPALFPALDRLRQLLVTSEDVAGNLNLPNDEQGAGSDPQQVLRIFLDTQGPQIVDPDGAGPQHAVRLTDNPATPQDESLYDLFDPKPSVAGPTPPVTSLTISVRDLPARTAPDFLYPVLAGGVAVDVGHYQVVGDHSGRIAVQSITLIPDPNPPADNAPATGVLRLTFNAPLPDDRYTLTISDALVDVAGNALDGETNTSEPQENPVFPTGDGVAGGDFVARFTVDSRPELATFCCTGVYADINGNFVFDPEGQDNDATNRDLVFNFGMTTDAIFAGNFSPAGAAPASGFDKLGSYGLANGMYRFQLDLLSHDGVADFTSVSGFQINAIPIAGEFSAAHPGDEIGLFDGQRWYLDSDGDNVLETTDTVIISNLRGLPIVGDFNGDGADDLATFDVGLNRFFFDLNRDGTVDDTMNFGFPGLLERPVAGDLNLDGIDDLGLWLPGRQGQTPRETAEWFFLVSDQQANLPSNVFNAYSPAPLGNDLFAQFGDEFAAPLLANLDPPLTMTPEITATTADGNTPDATTPDANTPDANTPDANTPDGTTPDANTPDGTTPDGNTPDGNTPDGNTPDGNTPDGNTAVAPTAADTTADSATTADETPANSAPLNKPLDPFDVNADGFVTALDALAVINALNSPNQLDLSTQSFALSPLDTNRDGVLGPLDALGVINRVNAAKAQAGAEGEAASEAFSAATSLHGIAHRPSETGVGWRADRQSLFTRIGQPAPLPVDGRPGLPMAAAGRKPSGTANPTDKVSLDRLESLESVFEAIAADVTKQWKQT